MAILDPYPAPGNPLQTLTQFERMFARFQWSGIDGTPGGTGMQASLDPASRAVVVATGAATTHAIRWECDAPVSTPIPAASAQDRIDRLVLRLDRTKATPQEYVFLKVLTGTPGSNTPPSITRTDDGIFDDYICQWRSAASGALSDLQDERSWMATDGIVPCFSWRRPSSGFGSLMGELDTGKFRVGLGAGQFITFAEDTGEIALAAGGFWKISPGLTVAGRRLNGWVRIRLALTRTTNTLHTSDTDGSPLLATLPASLRPNVVEYGRVSLSGRSSAELVVNTSGDVTLFGITEDLPVGATLRGSITYPGS